MTAGALSAPSMALLRELSAAAASRAIEQAPIPLLRPATVTAGGFGTPQVRIDGSGEPAVTVQNITGELLTVGERVMVLLVPPHGAYVVGGIVLDPSTPEPPHVVGAPSQAAYVAPWAAFPGWLAPQYWIDPDGWVHLGGLAQRNAAASGSTIFTLPAGYRPPVDRIFVVNGGGTYQQITVGANGTVRWFLGAGAPTDVSLNGIRFFAGSFEQALVGGTNVEDVGQITFANVNTGAVNNVVGQMPLVHRRADGLVRYEGNMFSTTALPAIVGWLPQWAVRKYTVMQAILAYDGGAGVKASRVDFSHDGRFITRNVYIHVGAQFWLDGSGHWDQKAEGTGAWSYPVLGAGYSGYGAEWGMPRYRRDAYGVVHMSGLAAGGAIAAGTVLFTLPLGFRPPAGLTFGVMANDIYHRLDVLSTGAVQTGTAWPGGYGMFDVFFRAA